MDFEKLGYQFHMERGSHESPRDRWIDLSVNKGGREVGALFVQHDPTSNIDTDYHDTSVDVDIDERGRGLATELGRRLAAENPGKTFNVNTFRSEGGLRWAQKMQRENPEQYKMEYED